MTSDTRYVAQADVVDCDIGGERALLHLETNNYFTLNDTGAAIWPALTKPRSVEEVVALVTDRFDVSAERCRPDIERMLAEMVEARLLRMVPAA